MRPEDTRAARQAELDASIAAKRAKADTLEAQSQKIRATVNDDYAYWTQPAYNNAAGRAFERRRDRDRKKLEKAAEIYAEAKKLRRQADTMEQRGVCVAGDAAAAHAAKQAACTVAVGDIVDTTFYGRRRVIKVNRKTVLVEASTCGLKVDKAYIRPIPNARKEA